MGARDPGRVLRHVGSCPQRTVRTSGTATICVRASRSATARGAIAWASWSGRGEHISRDGVVPRRARAGTCTQRLARSSVTSWPARTDVRLVNVESSRASSNCQS